MSNPQVLSFQNIESLMFKGKYDKALSDLEIFVNEEEQEERERYKGLFLKCKILNRKDDFTASFQLAEQLLKESHGKGIHEVDAYIAMASALLNLFKVDEGLDAITKGEKVLDSLTEVPQFDLKKRQAHVMNLHGYICGENNEFDRMLEYHQRALALNKEIGYDQGIASSLHSIGRVYHVQGLMEQALVSYHQAVTIREELGDKEALAGTLNNMGTMYYMQGLLTQGAEHLKQSSRLIEELGISKTLQGMHLYNIAHIEFMRGQLAQAKQDLEQALPLFVETNHEFCEIATCFLLTKINLKTNSPDEAQRYLQQMQRIQSEASSLLLKKSMEPLTLLTQALALKANPRARAKFEAQEILQQLSEIEIHHPSLKMEILFNLCELLLDEFKVYNEITVIQEAETIVQKALELGQNHQSFPLVVEALLLQTKFNLVQGNLTEATKILEQAYLTAEKYGLVLLTKQVSEEKKRLDSQFGQWEDLIQRNAPLQERIKKAELFEYLKEAQNLAMRDRLMPSSVHQLSEV